MRDQKRSGTVPTIRGRVEDLHWWAREVRQDGAGIRWCLVSSHRDFVRSRIRSDV